MVTSAQKVSDNLLFPNLSGNHLVHQLEIYKQWKSIMELTLPMHMNLSLGQFLRPITTCTKVTRSFKNITQFERARNILYIPSSSSVNSSIVFSSFKFLLKSILKSLILFFSSFTWSWVSLARWSPRGKAILKDLACCMQGYCILSRHPCLLIFQHSLAKLTISPA